MAVAMTPADAASVIGGAPVDQMLGLYEPLDVIGTGSFGIIRKVKRKTDGMVLARKELNYARMEGRDLKQLNEEVNVLQTLHSNDHIIRYHERYVDPANFLLYIIMEYAENGDLSHVIRRCRRDNTLLPEEVVWCYLTQIACALYDCHSEYNRQGVRKAIILHRDIKPENVFLDKDNMIKLGDFGLSKAMTATFATTYVGTPYYMSPELINGKEYDIKSDIWALGCLIYELCAWHPPFHEAQNQNELTKLVREGKIPPLPTGYSKDLDTVVRSMLRQNPKHRPTTKQVKTLDQVKIQMRVLELHRINESLRSKRKALDLREAEIAERERKAAVRERQIEVDKSDIASERQKLGNLRAQLLAHQERMHAAQNNQNNNRNINSNESTSPFLNQHQQQQDESENVPPPPGSSSGIEKPPGSRSGLARRPLEERRSIPNLTQRLSTCSLMSIDDAGSPAKFIGSPAHLHQLQLQQLQQQQQNQQGQQQQQQQPSSARARRVASARSLHNLMAAEKAAATAAADNGQPMPPLPIPLSLDMNYNANNHNNNMIGDNSTNTDSSSSASPRKSNTSTTTGKSSNNDSSNDTTANNNNNNNSNSNSNSNSNTTQQGTTRQTRRTKSEPNFQGPPSPSKRQRPPLPEQMSEAAITAINAMRDNNNSNYNNYNDDASSAAPTSASGASSSGQGTPTGIYEETLPSPFVSKTANSNANANTKGADNDTASTTTQSSASSVRAALGVCAKVARNGLRQAPSHPSTQQQASQQGQGQGQQQQQQQQQRAVTTGVKTRRQSLAERLRAVKADEEQRTTNQTPKQQQQQLGQRTPNQRPPSRQYSFATAARMRRASSATVQSTT